MNPAFAAHLPQSTQILSTSVSAPSSDSANDNKKITVGFTDNQFSVTKEDGSTTQLSNKDITELFGTLDSALDSESKATKDALSAVLRDPIVAKLGHHFSNLEPGQITFVEKVGFDVISADDKGVEVKAGATDKDKTSIPGFFVMVRENGELEITDEVPNGKSDVNQIDFAKENNPKKFTKTKEMFLLNNKIINSAAHLLVTDKSTGKQYALLLKTGEKSYQSTAGSAELQDIKNDNEGNVKMAESLLSAATRELAEEAFGLPKEDAMHTADEFLSDVVGLRPKSAPLVQIKDRGNGDFVRAGRPEFNVNTCLSPAVILDCEVEDIASIESKLTIEEGHENEQPVLMEVSDLLGKAKEKGDDGKKVYDFRGANFAIKDASKGELEGVRVNS